MTHKRNSYSDQWSWQQNEFLQFVEPDDNGVTLSATENSLIGKHWTDLRNVAPESARWDELFETVTSRKPFFYFEFPILMPDGKSTQLSLCGVPVHDSQGCFKGYHGVGLDITKQKNAEATISSLTQFDQLTGLSNRRHLLERINFARLNGFPSEAFGALIFVDIDSFKTFNEAVGHDLADILLVEIGGRLSKCVRDYDTVARIGGDVFVVLATNLGNTAERASQGVQRIAQKITIGLEAPFTPSMDIALTVSPLAPRFSTCMGISLFQGTDTSVEDIMKRAESALRQAKESGRGVVRYFDLEIDSLVNHRVQLEKELLIAIETDQLRLYYQPIVGINRNVLGYEALIRWQHTTDGILSPGAFIEIAESTGLIVPMGEWVVRSVCTQLVIFQKDPSTRHLTIAVNLSARQLAQPDIAEVIRSIVTSSGAPPNRLKLEITESMLLTDIEQTIEKMSSLSDLGIRFSLDDFGTGYSSLGYLKKLHLSQLKVDQSFVKGLLVDPVDFAIVRTIIQLAKSLGMSVIAEGVESEGQHQALSNMGCREFQGYLFGKPYPIE